MKTGLSKLFKPLTHILHVSFKSDFLYYGVRPVLVQPVRKLTYHVSLELSWWPWAPFTWKCQNLCWLSLGLIRELCDTFGVLYKAGQWPWLHGWGAISLSLCGLLSNQGWFSACEILAPFAVFERMLVFFEKNSGNLWWWRKRHLGLTLHVRVIRLEERH